MQDVRPAVKEAQTAGAGYARRLVHHLVELAVPLVFPSLGQGDGLRHVRRCTPAFSRGLMQVSGW